MALASIPEVYPAQHRAMTLSIAYQVEAIGSHLPHLAALAAEEDDPSAVLELVKTLGVRLRSLGCSIIDLHDDNTIRSEDLERRMNEISQRVDGTLFAEAVHG